MWIKINLKGLLAGVSKFNILINLLGGANISKNHVCAKSVDDSKQLSIFCDLCKFWVHSKCNCLCIEQWFCSKCISVMFPVGTLNQNFIFLFLTID